MILECPSCNAKFTVPDGAIGSDGKQVRCGKCSNIWLAKPSAGAAPAIASAAVAAPAPAPAPVTPATTPTPDLDAVLAGLAEETEENKPKNAQKSAKPKVDKEKRTTLGDYKTPVSRKKNPLYIAAFCFIYLLLGAAIFIVLTLKNHPDWFGFESSQGFAFEEMRVERMTQLGGERFTTMPMYKLEGIVRNTSDKPRVRPPIKVTLKNNTGGEVYTKDYPSPTTIIPAGDAIAFTIERLEQPDTQDTVFIVQMGNSLEYMLREIPDTSSAPVSKPKREKAASETKEVPDATADATPESTPTPTLTQVPTPAAEPAAATEPAHDVTPEPTPEVVPDAPESTPEPLPVDAPEPAAPESTPESAVEITPEAAPEVTPAVTTEPAAEPEPTPEVVAEPEPTPEPTPEVTPEPVAEPEPKAEPENAQH